MSQLKIEDKLQKDDAKPKPSNPTNANEVSQYRLNLTLSPEAKNELETLKTKTKKSSLVDVLRAALIVYKMVIDHQELGGRIVFRNKDNKEETFRFI